jgi:hypothetical protein
MLGRLKRDVHRPEPAWHFPHGSTQVKGTSANKYAADAFVFTDGRFMPSPANDTSDRVRAGTGNLNVTALIRMAEMLNLT